MHVCVCVCGVGGMHVVCAPVCLLLLCYGSSGSFTAPEEVVLVGVFNLWPRGYKGVRGDDRGRRVERRRD